MPKNRLLALALITSSFVGSIEAQTADTQWGSWRGPLGSGAASDEANPPTTWSEEENIRWKVPIPGLGISSPIVWKGRVYLTAAIDTEEEGETTALEPADRRAAPLPTNIYEFVVLCLDRGDGSVIWRRTLAKTVPHEGGHSTNSHASFSPLTDGERLYINFGSRGLYCLDMDGEVIWSKQFGTMRTRRQYGEASSPTIHGDTLVLNWDHEGDSFIIALDKRSGDELWRRDRDEVTSWSTPLVAVVDGRAQVVINATAATRGYDLESGEVLWSLAGMTVNCIPSPIEVDGVAYVMSGYRGQMLQAVRLKGSKGDLAGSEQVIWSHTRNTSYVPSALFYEGLLYFVRGNNGVLSCLDAETGTVQYEGQRLGLRSIYASPVAADGRIFLTSRNGITKVIQAGPDYEELATNTLDDDIDASAAIVDDEIYLRGRSFLYCIGEQ